MKRNEKDRFRAISWIKKLPGHKKDYILLSILLFDLLLLLFSNAYAQFIGMSYYGYVLIFDFMIIVLWGWDFLLRIRKVENKREFLFRNWYELAGLFPLYYLRPLLLLRGVKLLIAFYKFGRADQDVSSLLTKELTFRFRDVIVDTIADAVFLHSLSRVEQVMMRLDYSTVARNAFGKYQEKLRKNVNESLQTKFLLSELSKIPFMSEIGGRLGEDVSSMIIEILEQEVTGEIMKDITGAILKEMADRVRELDLERITSSGAERKSLVEESEF